MRPPTHSLDSIVRVRALEPERLAERAPLFERLAERAQRAWAVMPLDERLTRIERWQKRMHDRRDELVSALAKASDVSEHDVRVFEVEPLFRALTALVSSTQLRGSRAPHGDAQIVRHPLGVIELGGDGAFARPLFELASAVAAGNAVLTDRGEPFLGAWDLARQTFVQSGLPEDLWVQASDAVRWLEAPAAASKPPTGPAMIVALSRAGITAAQSLASALRPAGALRHRGVLAHVCTTPDQVDEVTAMAPEAEVHAVRHQHDVGDLIASLSRPHIVYALDPHADRALVDQWRALIVRFDATPLSDVDVLMATEDMASRFVRSTVIFDSALPPLSRAWNQIAKRWRS